MLRKLFKGRNYTGKDGMRRNNVKKVVAPIGTGKLNPTLCKEKNVNKIFIKIKIAHNEILVSLYLVSQHLGLWSTWVNLIFSILTNCNFAFCLDAFFSQKYVLALKVKKSRKEILDSLYNQKKTMKFYTFFCPRL